MAEWNKGKVLPSDINGGQEFTKKDNLAINELNAIVNNSFYASEKADRAEQLAESAVKGNGTLVTINGQIQGEWSADFAESERQKSKNLFNINKLHFATPNNISIDTSNGVITFNNQSNASTDNNALKNFSDLEVGKTYTLSFNSTSAQKFIYLNGSGYSWYNGSSHTITQEELDAGVHMYGVSSGVSTIKDIQIEEGTVVTDYQRYNGAITHNGDTTVVFAEEERQKSRNKFPIKNITANSVEYAYFPKPLPSGDYTLSAIVSSNSPDTQCLVEVYNKGIWITQFKISKSNTREVAHRTITSTFDELRFYAGVTNISGYNASFEEIMLTTDGTSDYQQYNGEIVHEKEIIPTVIYDLYNGKTRVNDRDYGSGIYTGVDLNYNFKTDKKYRFYVVLNGYLILMSETFMIPSRSSSEFGVMQKLSNENTVFLYARIDSTKLHISGAGYYNNATGNVTWIAEGGYAVVKIEEIDL